MYRSVKCRTRVLRCPVLSSWYLGRNGWTSHVRTFLSTPMPEVEQMHPGIRSYEDLYKFSVEKPEIFWRELAKRLEWKKPFSNVLHGNFQSGVKWFTGGKLNVSVNCVDRHARENPDRVAVIFEKDEPNQHEIITYGKLQEIVQTYAGILRKVGKVEKGDRVALYLPCGPTALAMMLACARIGAIHTVVFAGFSADALASRINDAEAKVLVTADIAVRGGKVLNLKKVADDALERTPCVKTVIVDAREKGASQVEGMKFPRDAFLHELEKEKTDDVIEFVDSNDPLFILYTSGSTGQPKGLLHTSANYLLYTMITQNSVFNFHPGDSFGCVADIGWITGHSYAVYGPLANGGTTLLFESTPVYPDPGRYWEMVQRLQLTHFYCAPTAIRLLMKYGTKWVKQYDRSSLRVLGSVGEPINREAWTWYNDVVGDKRCTVIDTWWQTETGGIAISPRPSGPNDPIEPGMPMRPFFGIKPLFPKCEKTGGEEEGPLCIEKPWPGLAATVWKSPDRFKETYFSQYPPYYFTGDGATRNAEGYWKITGRMDDVINVTGHRLGTAEVEEALNMHALVSESAVVGYPHDVKGEGIFAYVVLKDKGKSMDREKLNAELRAICRSHIAAYAAPDYILYYHGLPKTRSGKIMRRILRKIAAGTNLQELGDITTLAEPGVVQKLLDIRKTLEKA